MDGKPRQNKMKLISVTFGEGSLGVTLRRRPEDGVVFVFDIVENSQAVDMDISVGDELWSIGESEIGDVALDKEAWNGLVQYIKFSPRPLKATWRRKGMSSRNESPVDLGLSEASENLPAENAVNNANEEEPEVVSKTNPFRLANPGPVKPPKPVRTASSSILSEPSKTASSSVLSDSDSDLQELSNRLVLKEKANGFSAITSKRGADTSAVHLMKEGRKILRTGELETTTKAALAMWATQNKKQFILLTDMLIIATPVGAQLQVENMIDLPVCKLYCEGQSTGESNAAQSNSDGARQENTFQLIWPGGTLLITARSADEKERWVESIFTAICECVEADSSHVLGWRHQYMQGSMHSAVISRDESKVKDLISKCECGLLSFTVIDSLDEDGYSPLHYACILRLPGIIRALCDTGSDTTIEDSRGLTPFHWAALQLDEQALSILCQHVVDIDLQDHKGRTPLYLACVEGRDVSGKTDSRMLAQCLKSLLANSADTDFKDEQGYTVTHYLAASWQHEPLKVILDHTEKANIFSFSAEDGMNALHYACDASPLKRAVGEGSWILSNTQASNGEDDPSPTFKDVQQEELLIEDGLPTLKALLKAGSRPNLRDGQGKSPLQLLAESAEVWGNRFGDAVDTLVCFGARLDEFPDVAVIKDCPAVSLEESVLEWTSLTCVDADDLGINKTPHSKFKDQNYSDVKGKSKLKESSKDKDKDRDKNCVLCDFKFTMFKRQHHCRLCDCVCCDDCSKKKALVEDSQVRCCDSCFNFLSHETERQRLASTQKQAIKSSRSSSTSSASNPTSPHTSSSSAQAKQARGLKDLFGNATIAPGRERSDTKTATAATGISGTMSAMSEVHDRLLERGEKLNKLTDKSADVANAAEEFAKLAKQLNDQQKSRWF